MLLIDTHAKVMQLFTNIAFTDTRRGHPVVIIVMMNQPSQKSLIKRFGPSRNFCARIAGTASKREYSTRDENQQ